MQHQYKKRIILRTYFAIEIIIKSLHKFFIALIFFSLSVSFIFSLFNFQYVEAAIIKNDKLMERISKDYTNKFCNSLAFGLARESAMNFSNQENNLIFKKKKGFDSLNKYLIANKIAISVVGKCGYLINLSGEDGIEEFTNDYISINNFNVKEN